MSGPWSARIQLSSLSPVKDVAGVAENGERAQRRVQRLVLLGHGLGERNVGCRVPRARRWTRVPDGCARAARVGRREGTLEACTDTHGNAHLQLAHVHQRPLHG